MKLVAILLLVSIALLCDGLAVKKLPEKVIVGYASRCDGSVIRAVQHGVNVVIWSFLHVPPATVASQVSSTRKLQQIRPMIETSLDLECIQQEIQSSRQFNDNVVHLVGFGGWNGAHFDEMYPSQMIYDSWKRAYGNVFDGIDWDFEGNDDLQSPYNYFTLDCLDKMGQISQLAKKDGYIVSVAPPQSYLDLSSTRFSRFVNLTHVGRTWHSDFSHAGSNIYAYLMARYGDNIDMVSIQLYESYSRAAYDITQLGVSPATYLEAYVEDLALRHEQFYVDFSQDSSLNMKGQMVKLPLSKLVIGLANGWADGSKSLFLDPEDVLLAHVRLCDKKVPPRGFMFWTIDEEGTSGMYMSKALHQVMNAPC